MFANLWSTWLKQLWRRNQPQRRPTQAKRRHRSCRLELQILEDRTVPTAVVATQADLIAAINAANLAGGTNYITLAADITLFETTPFINSDGATGLPQITSGDRLTIFGNSHTLQRSLSTGDAAFRLFDVGPGASLTLDQMTLENGLETGPVAQGGAIDVNATAILTLNADTIASSSVNYTGGGSTPFIILQGGAIYNAGTANLVNSLIEGNSAYYTLTNALGQGDNQGDASAAGTTGNNSGNGLTGSVLIQGGGIFNTGNLSVTTSAGIRPFFLSRATSFSTANLSGPGSAILDNIASCTITNGSLFPGDFTGNGNFDGNNDTTANNGNGNGNGVVGNITVQGGGICNVHVISLTGVTISGNVAQCNVANGSGNGNNNSVGDTGDNNGNGNGNGVTGNVAVAGGGIYNNGPLTAFGANVSGNLAHSSVINGSNNGGADGVNTHNSDGNDNGDGVDGTIRVSGGGITNDSGGTVFLGSGSISQNQVSSSITNASANGSGDGDNNTGTNEGRNNGNGVVGFVEVSGGGLDNESGGHVTLASTVSFNSAASNVTNGSGCGDNCGDSNGANDGDGDGLASDLTVHGGGIRNAGTLTTFSSTFYANSATSSITNGTDNGNGCGNNDGEGEEGRADGNGVSGNVLIAGGAIANSASLGVLFSTFTYNSVNSYVSNGNGDGNNDGKNDANFNNCGNNCGNAIGEGPNGQLDLKVDGGAIGNSGIAFVYFSSITNNGAFSTVFNPSDSGTGNGAGSTGASGLGDGNGVHGDMEVVGGGTANFGTLNFLFCTISGNSVSSNINSGPGNTALDGQLVDGTVTVAGSDTFG